MSLLSSPVFETNDDPDKYRIISLIGEGAFGRVYEVESSDRSRYALKINIGFSKIDGMISLKEANFSKSSDYYPYLLLIDKIIYGNPFIKPPTLQLKNDGNVTYKKDSLYFLMEIADMTLDTYLTKDRNTGKYLRYDELIPDIKSFMWQMLCAVEFMHAKGFMHRDIKPDNLFIFIDPKKNVKLIKMADYGFVKNVTNNLNTVNIQNANYRAPEIALGCRKYTKSVDIWSLGIVFYLMVTKKLPIPRLSNQDNEVELIKKLHTTFNLNPNDYPNARPEYIDLLRKIPGSDQVTRDLKRSIDRSFKDYFNIDDCIDLISKMLDPKINRITASECLKHDFFTRVTPDTDPEINYINMNKYMRDKFNLDDNGNLTEIRKYKIIVSSSPLRNIMKRYAQLVYNARSTSKDWYTFHIWCASIDLFDRWLVYKLTTTEEKEISEDTVMLAYYSCLYIMIKTCSNYVMRFALIDHGLTNRVREFIDLEKEIVIDAVDYSIRRPTLVEELEELSYYNSEEDDVRIMNIILNNLHLFNGRSWYTVAMVYNKTYRNSNI